MKKSHLAGIAVLVALIAFAVYIVSSQPSGPGRYDDLAKCLTEKGAVMYGTEWCPHCQNQKKLFGSSFQYISYVDCDRNQNACIGAGVDGYPTWKINGTNYPGEQNIYKLMTASGCTAVTQNTTTNA